MNKNRKIKFKNIGKKKQHEVTLVDILERDVDMTAALISETENKQTYTEELMSHYWTQVQTYLKTKGFDDPFAHYRVLDGNVVKCDYVWKPLWSAIQERDNLRDGQSGEYLAAFINHLCWMFEIARCQTLWHKTTKYLASMQDIAMNAQSLFVEFRILEKIHAQYSAGKSRTNEAHKERNKKSFFESKAEKIFLKLRSKKPRPTKEQCYMDIAHELKKIYPARNPPQAGTIKDWFKGRKDLI